MPKLIRGIVIAGLVAFALVLVLAGTAYSQNWNTAIDTGLTSVSWVLQGDTLVWTLTNNSSLASDQFPAFDILVWDVMPYRIQEPASWSAPEGWTWNGKKMELASNSGRYYTPYALAPGQSLTFTYQPKVGGKYINTSGPSDMGPLFASHVGAVIPGSGSLDAARRWDEYRAEELGNTWRDQTSTERYYTDIPVIPEMSGLLVLGFGGVSLATCFIPRRRRLQ
jgi:hypothetical protein